MVKKILRMLINTIEHIKINISDYTLLMGLILILRWVYVVKGFDSFTLCLGFLLILFSFVNIYNEVRGKR